jgi:hypothetical protein
MFAYIIREIGAEKRESGWPLKVQAKISAILALKRLPLY